MVLKKGPKQMWRLATKDNSEPILIAEPKHRIGAVGVSSGVSLRKFPKSTVQKVREICIQYVEKCSGKYENNKVAARYVHQMADEVICQLAGVAAQIRKAHKNQPENMQQLLDDWNTHFPPSLGAVGSPATVAATLLKQSNEIEGLLIELETERVNHVRDVSDVMQSTNMQLHASCEGVMSERRQVTIAQHQQKLNFDRQMQETLDENEQRITNLKESNRAKILSLQETYTTKERDGSKQLVRLEEKLREDKEKNALGKKETDNIMKKERENFIKQINFLKEQLLAAQGVVSSSSRDGSLDENQSVVGLSYEDEEGTDRKKILMLTGTVGRAVKQLKEKYENSYKRCERSAEVIEVLRTEKELVQQDRDLYKSRVGSLQSLNEALRKALSVQVYNQVDDSGIKAAKSIYIVSRPTLMSDRLSI